MKKQVFSVHLEGVIPDYLRPYIVQQDPNLYTAIDHAAWRFTLKLSQNFFASHAHQKYLDGLEQTGISTERIPLISEMNQKLSKFGWQAVAVSGFIPPAVFMEYLSLGILPIACDMRKLEHLAYTPSPDIVHEAAGHAPIIADPGYARYLRKYGELARKVIFSHQDMDVYQAIRTLSDLKENPKSTQAEIEGAEQALQTAAASVTFESEATWLARMSWWTIEYGLVGEFDQPKIYGAGLLSSMGESYHCLSREIIKIPLTLDCIKQSYDITRPQPQLYVARDFDHLTEVLEELEQKMAYKLGQKTGIERALASKTVTTTVLDSGLQISGALSEARFEGGAENPTFVRFLGPVQLSFADQELVGHSARTHGHGFSSPLGKISAHKKDASRFTRQEVSALLEKNVTFEFDSGFKLTGILKSEIRKEDRVLILSFENCSVFDSNGQRVYQPEWGTFDLACGETIPSVFGGAADRKSYFEVVGGFDQPPALQKSNLTVENAELNQAYLMVRKIREALVSGPEAQLKFEAVFSFLKHKAPQDWLLRYELLELLFTPGFSQFKPQWEPLLRSDLAEISKISEQTAELVTRGLELLPRIG